MSRRFRSFTLAAAMVTVLVTAPLTALGTAGALPAGPPAAASVPVTDLDPADLPRGADIAIPHVDGTTFVDGDRRVRIDAERVALLGTSGRAFILGTTDEDGVGTPRVVRLRPDGTTRTLLRSSPWSITVSEDGRKLVRLRNGTRRSSPVSVHSARSGRRLVERGSATTPACWACAATACS